MGNIVYSSSKNIYDDPRDWEDEDYWDNDYDDDDYCVGAGD